MRHRMICYIFMLEVEEWTLLASIIYHNGSITMVKNTILEILLMIKHQELVSIFCLCHNIMKEILMKGCLIKMDTLGFLIENSIFRDSLRWELLMDKEDLSARILIMNFNFKGNGKIHKLFLENWYLLNII